MGIYVLFTVPPTWVNEPEDSFVILGNSVILDCLTSGLPQPKLTWKKASGRINRIKKDQSMYIKKINLFKNARKIKL